MTIFRRRTRIFHISNSQSSDLGKVRPKNWSARSWAWVILAAILTIAGLEGYALSLGIDVAALRAALMSIGILGGAGFGRVFK